MDSGGNSRDHSNERRHYTSNVQSLSGIAGGGHITVGVDDAAMIREHGFEKRHYDEDGEKMTIEKGECNHDSTEKKPNEPSNLHFERKAAGVMSGIGQMSADHGDDILDNSFEKKHVEQAVDAEISFGSAPSHGSPDKPPRAAAGGDYGGTQREHGLEKKHFEQADDNDEKTLAENSSYETFSEKKRNSAQPVHSLSGIAGGGQMTFGVDDGPMVREHGFEKRHYEQADDYDQAN